MQKISVVGCCFSVALLAGCGGSGFEPQITGIKPVVLQYGRTATVQIGGIDLRTSLQADLGSGCTSPSYATYSTPELLVLNCNVVSTGDLPLSIKNAQGEVIYSATLKVPMPQVTLTTSAGTIIAELNPVAAPITVNNFLSYVNKGYYKDTLFHRVIAGFMVQGGGFTTGMVKKTGQAAPIVLESNKGLLNLRGTLAMARTDVANSATSEFFINLTDNPFLDYKNALSPGYAVFGTVVKGLDTVDAIAAQTTGTVKGFENVPKTDITITSAQQTQ